MRLQQQLAHRHTAVEGNTGQLQRRTCVRASAEYRLTVLVVDEWGLTDGTGDLTRKARDGAEATAPVFFF